MKKLLFLTVLLLGAINYAAASIEPPKKSLKKTKSQVTVTTGENQALYCKKTAVTPGGTTVTIECWFCNCNELQF